MGAIITSYSLLEGYSFLTSIISTRRDGLIEGLVVVQYSQKLDTVVHVDLQKWTNHLNTVLLQSFHGDKPAKHHLAHKIF